MPIFQITIEFPPFSEKMHSSFKQLKIEDYKPQFLEEKILLDNIFTDKTVFAIYFEELKKFLALNHLYDDEIGMVNKQIDHIWHQFILFTREYHAFCDKYFGKYIHHTPSLESNEEKTQMKEKAAAENFFKLYYKTFGQIPNIWVS